MQLKKEYAKEVLTANELIQKSSEWDWAAANIAKLQGILSRLGTETTSFGKHFLANEVKDVKKEYKEKNQIFEQEVLRFLDGVREPLKDLAKQSRLINASLAVRNSIACFKFLGRWVPTCEATTSNRESTESIKTTIFKKDIKKTVDDSVMKFDDVEVDRN